MREAHRACLGCQQQFGVRLEGVEHRFAERDQPLARRRARTERRIAADDFLLKVSLALREHRGRERRPRAEAAKEGALADASRIGDLVHRHAAGAAFVEQPSCDAEDPLAIARCIRALAAFRLREGEIE